MLRTRTKILSFAYILAMSVLFGSNGSNDIYKQVRKNQSLINDVYDENLFESHSCKGNKKNKDLQ